MPSPGCAACSRSRCGTRGRGSSCSPAIASASSRCTTRCVNGRLYFGSEIKSILEAPDVPRDLDLDALNHYLSFLYTPRDESIFQGHPQAAAGSSPHLDATAGCTWSGTGACRHARPFEGSEAEAVSELHGVLVDAVRSHLVSDVPLGAFLSGGVDSSLVVGLMAEASSGGRVKTFSIGFDEPVVRRARARTAGGAPLRDRSSRVRREAGRGRDSRFADRAFRRAVRRFVGHPDVVRLGDGPASTSRSCSPGDGGDELFGGYDRYLPHPRVVAFDRFGRGTGRRVAAIAATHLPHGALGKNFFRHVARDARGRYLDAIRFFSPDEKCALLAPDVVAQLSVVDPEARLARLVRPVRGTALAESDDAVRRRDVPAGGRADESGPHEHGAFDRVARAAARQRGRRVRVRAAGRAQDQGRASQTHPEGGRGPAAAARKS